MAKKLVIIGGGFAGINLAKSLKYTSYDITIIDRYNHHLFQPLLYQVATAALAPADIAIPLREIFRKQRNVKIFLGEVKTVDKENRKVILNNQEIEFDYLAICTGSRHSYFGKDEWEKSAPGLKTLSDALKIRERMLMSFEVAERFHENIDMSEYLNFVIIGGGPTGVEMAGAITEIAKITMIRDFRNINPAKAKIYLIEGSNQILNAYPEDLSTKAKKSLEALGVKVITGAIVTNVVENGIYIGEQFIKSRNVIWAAGNKASSFISTLGIETDKAGRALVNKDLSIGEFNNIFVLGDAACYLENEKPLPGIAPVAIQQAQFLADILKNFSNSINRPAFKYFDKGSMATIGRAKAIALVGKTIKLSGFSAWLAWSFIHILYLIGFRNKYKVMSEWFFQYITLKHGCRLITGKAKI